MSEFRHIVRVIGTDLDGTKKLVYGLAKIKGIDVTLAEAIAKVTGLDPNTRIGSLTEGEVKKIEDTLKEPTKYGIPNWLVNHQKDVETGQPKHFIGPDLILRVKSDIDFMQKIKSWKGIRHSFGLKVRGQRTKTTGRFGKAVGVRKALIIAAARAAAAPGAPGAAPAAPTGAPGAAAAAPTAPTKAVTPKKEETKEKKA